MSNGPVGFLPLGCPCSLRALERESCPMVVHNWKGGGRVAGVRSDSNYTPHEQGQTLLVKVSEGGESSGSLT